MDEAEVSEATAAGESATEPAIPEAAPAEAAPAETAPDTEVPIEAPDVEAALTAEEPIEAVTEPVTADDGANGRIERIIESVLFAAAGPVSLKRLVEILAGPTPKEVLAAVRRLMDEYAPGQRGIQFREVAGGYQLRTARENAEWVRAAFREKPARLGRATLETLAIVAYKQPVTRPDIEAIRGVDVDGVLSSLLSRRLIKIAGRKEAVGRPLLYATTPEFLEIFGLKDLNELPSLKELGPAPDADEDGLNAETEQEERPVPEPQGEGAGEADAPAAAETEPGAPADAAETNAGADGTPAEDPESGRDCVEAKGGGTDPSGTCAPERTGGDTAGDEGEPADRSDHD
jgi:segregation and condensation protein B